MLLWVNYRMRHSEKLMHHNEEAAKLCVQRHYCQVAIARVNHYMQGRLPMPAGVLGADGGPSTSSHLSQACQPACRQHPQQPGRLAAGQHEPHGGARRCAAAGAAGPRGVCNIVEGEAAGTPHSWLARHWSGAAARLCS